MNAEAIVTVSAAVVALTQLIKMSGVPTDNRAVVLGLVLGFSLLGVLAWGFSHEPGLDRGLLWPYLAGWITVATSAAGVFSLAQKTPDVTEPSGH